MWIDLQTHGELVQVRSSETDTRRPKKTKPEFAKKDMMPLGLPSDVT